MRGNSTLRTVVPARQPRQGRRNRNQRPHFTPKEATKLILSGTLPANSVITGHLSFFNTAPIFSPGTHIRGNLQLSFCIEGLQLAPDKMIDGIADLSETPLTSLPKRLQADSLDVSGTRIREFPTDLKVGWRIVVDKNATRGMKARAAALANKTLAAKAARRAGTAPS